MCHCQLLNPELKVEDLHMLLIQWKYNEAWKKNKNRHYSISNKVYRKFGKIDLKDYIRSITSK